MAQTGVFAKGKKATTLPGGGRREKDGGLRAFRAMMNGRVRVGGVHKKKMKMKKRRVQRIHTWRSPSLSLPSSLSFASTQLRRDRSPGSRMHRTRLGHPLFSQGWWKREKRREDGCVFSSDYITVHSMYV